MAKKGKKHQPALEHMPLIQPHAAGLDGGAEEPWGWVPADRDPQPVQTLSALTCDVSRLADWLTACRLTTVVMEVTGVYWLPLLQSLDARGFAVALVTARHAKHVPGRPTTDRCECQWLPRFHSDGLLASSLRPPEAICQLRSVVRHRARVLQRSAQPMPHRHKSLDHVPGLQAPTIHIVLSEVDLDMSKWPTDTPCASW